MPSRATRSTTADASPQFHAQTVQQVALHFSADTALGLTTEQAKQRLDSDGPNTITVRRPQPAWLRFLLQFNAPLVYILLAAVVVTLFLAEYLDSAVIFAVVLINAVIGFIEESRAVRAIDALSKSMRFSATVLRDGIRQAIDAAELVTGDIVYLEAGDKAPADLRLITTRDLRVDESMLTGESKPVAKATEPTPPDAVLADRTCMVYAGSLITRGAATAVVIATSDRTEIGRLSEMIATADVLATPLTRKITDFSRLLVWAIIAVALVTFIVGILRGNNWVEMFKAAVALAVGAIPEGLPAAMTIMLAVGVARMAKRNAIIRKLPAVEALGSTTVICSDKTGTLTQNQMTVHAVSSGGRHYDITGVGYEPTGDIRHNNEPAHAEQHPALSLLLTCGALCNDASLIYTPHAASTDHWKIHGDPTEAALVVAARKLHSAQPARQQHHNPAGGDHPFAQESLAARYPRLDAVPFESDRQYMATLHDITHDTDKLDTDQRVIFIKGSVERILAMCSSSSNGQPNINTIDEHANPTQIAAQEIHDTTNAWGARGLRVLAFARVFVPPETQNITHEDVEHLAAASADERSTQQPRITFLGMQGMLDPPRPEAINAVALCQTAGVSVKMITGDHARTAATIAGMIGISNAATSPHEQTDNNTHKASTPAVLTGAELADIPDDQLPVCAEQTTVFARMTPEQKLRLVRALQSRGHIVAMTGDGANDAPALRQADIGVAMGIAGTEVAKEAADIVLADDNFASIAAAVEEGRSVYANLTRFIVWTLPSNGGEAGVIFFAIILGWPLPILPVHALYINMVTAVLLGIPLVFEPKDPAAMRRPPRDPKRPLLTFELFMRTGLVSLLLCIAAMVVFQWQLNRAEHQADQELAEATARTAAVAVIVIGKLFYLFSCRSLLKQAWSVPMFSNPWLWAGIAAMLITQIAFTHSPIINRVFHSAPLDATAWLAVFAAGAIMLLIVELEKRLRRTFRNEPDAQDA